MHVRRLELRGFRNLVDDEITLVDGVTLVHGANGAGKTNLLEALYFGLSGRPCRTSRDREVIRFDGDLARVAVSVVERNGGTSVASGGTVAPPLVSTFLSSVARDGERRHLLDGRSMPPAETAARRPPLAVFMPDRLGLVKGPPSVRRMHLDRFVVALWPSREGLRQRYAQALAQRNALLGRIRAGVAGVEALDAWDRELASAAVELRRSRQAAVATIAAPFEELARSLGLEGTASARYAPRAPLGDAQELRAALVERRREDLARGFTTAGPHRDELELLLAGRSLRRYGSQGQQRVALLALLFAERQGLIDAGRPIPLMLLDDVMSELDRDRRRLLAERLTATGQALVTATEADAFPGTPDVELIVAGGALAGGDVGA